MSATCDIEFENNPRKIIYAGQLLRGTVRLNLTENFNVRSVYVRIRGKAFASWNSVETKVEVNEDYLDKKMYFVGSRESTSKINLEAGVHNYTFEFMLPSNVPSSIEGKYGQIKYTVGVVLDVPLWTNKVFKEPFTLMKALNLNDYPSLREPLIGEKIKGVYPFCFGFFCPKTITITARAPVGGFLPRQTVNLEIHVQNQSSVDVYKFTVELIRLISYSREYKYCGCKSNYGKKEEKCLFSKTIDGCSGKEEKMFHLDVDIPATPPTEIAWSKGITVTYLIRITAFMPGLYKNRSLYLPITIGSYPFQDQTSHDDGVVQQ
ncbi:arrestin domain-containing protein 1-like [Sitodiplosis mosellana]|uniref:arrestin domain-containing protein 1-like n=1 Tax=Sitodiplosis mosellana TaxID=263140 RepID=UPI0024447189|nr:arrestin domain-containing protein 1-like [Sitodiplosis mosellana]